VPNCYETAGELVAVGVDDEGGSEDAGGDVEGLGVAVLSPAGDFVVLGFVAGPRGSCFGFLLCTLAVFLSGGVVATLVAAASVGDWALSL
jgi:hypothetical protein